MLFSQLPRASMEEMSAKFKAFGGELYVDAERAAAGTAKVLDNPVPRKG